MPHAQPLEAENDFRGSETDTGSGSMTDSPRNSRRPRADSGSQRKGASVIQALRDLGKKPWLPSPLDAAAKWLTPSYETKNEDFRRLFKALPPDALLLDDYSCALQRDILVHGRMYVSQHHISFYANIFGWETIVVVPAKKITSITREKTAHVFPNALQITLSDGVEIHGTFASDPKPHGRGSAEASQESAERFPSERSTLHDKLWFTSFVSRDTTHTVLMKAWQNVLVDSPLSPVQLRHFACRCWGDKPDVTTDMAHAIMRGASITEDPLVVSSSGGSDEQSADFSGDAGPVSSQEGSSNMDGFDMIRQESCEDSSEKEQLAEEDEQPAELYEPVQCGCTSHKETYLNQTFNCPVDTLYQLLFTNSEFFKAFCRQHKTIDLRMQEWTPAESDGQHRQITYTLTLNKTMGPKFSPTTETQHRLEDSTPSKVYRVDVEVCNGGIPYGDVFCTVHRYCLTRESRYQSHLHVGADIHYRKSCWGLVKTFIERHCFQGMESYYKDLASNLEDECLKVQSVGSQHVSRSSSLSGSRASLPIEKPASLNVLRETPLGDESLPATTVQKATLCSKCQCGASLQSDGKMSPPLAGTPAAAAESVWSVSNILMFCLLIALLVNIGLLLNMPFMAPVSPPSYDVTPSVDDVFLAHQEEWRAGVIRRQEALHAAFKSLSQFYPDMSDAGVLEST